MLRLACNHGSASTPILGTGEYTTSRIVVCDLKPRDFLSFQKEKEFELTKKVEEMSEELCKLEDTNRSLLTDLEEATKTEQSNAKTYEDRLKVVY